MTDEITLTNDSKVGTGTWLDGVNGWTNTYRVIEIAESHGFKIDDRDRAAIEWYKETSGGCGDGTDAEEDMAEAIVGQGGLSDKATEYMQELLPEGWVLRWETSELSLMPAWMDCAADGNGCNVDYRDGRDVAVPCYDHKPDYVIVVELLRTDGYSFSYGIKLVDTVESGIVHGHTDTTFEAPGLDNLKVEGQHTHPSQIGAAEVQEAAERLIRKYQEEDKGAEVGDAGTGHGAYEYRSGH